MTDLRRHDITSEPDDRSCEPLDQNACPTKAGADTRLRTRSCRLQRRPIRKLPTASGRGVDAARHLTEFLFATVADQGIDHRRVEPVQHGAPVDLAEAHEEVVPARVLSDQQGGEAWSLR